MVAFSSFLYFTAVDVVTFAMLRHELGHVGLRGIAVSTLRSLVFGALGVAASYVLLTFTPLAHLADTPSIMHALLSVVIGGLTALFVTYGAAILFKVPETAAIRRLGGRLLHR